ncbi:hypothetical protein FSP39_012103 [Pinctada imbricata]|uniref:Uncharacterized protein n=1 Tax=Pinctada imbricata TaxID=66713 RepID=A0AA89BX96_PINIB|nr:hypothetical protein FSP39_012103 [Pinctada imbricata]
MSAHDSVHSVHSMAGLNESLNETGNIVVDSLNVVNDENSDDRALTTKDLDGIYRLLQSLDAKLGKIDDIDSRLIRIEGIVTKLENLEVRIGKTETDLSAAKREIKDIQKFCKETETCLDGYGNLLDGLRKDFTDVQSQNRSSNTRVKHTESAVADLKSEVEMSRDEIREDILDLQSRSMRENLLFFGIPEEEEEDCDVVLIDFLTDTMKIRTDISFEQFPVEIEQRRKALYPIMKEERRKKNKVKLVRDRLFINGSEYIPPAQRAGPTGASGRGTPSQQERKRAHTGSR